MTEEENFLNSLKEFIYKEQECTGSRLLGLKNIYLGMDKNKLEAKEIEAKEIYDRIKKAIGINSIKNLIATLVEEEQNAREVDEIVVDEIKKKITNKVNLEFSVLKLNERTGFENFLNQIAVKIRKDFDCLKGTVLDLVLIYEAPPFFKEWFDGKTTPEDELIKIDTYFSSKYFTGENATTPWRKQPLVAFGEQEKKGLDHFNKFSPKNLLILDILPVPIPIDSELRKNWSTDKKWEIGGKQLPVVLFELAINNMLNKGLKVHRDTKFALGMPVNTSLSIFQYYSDKPLRICDIGCDGCENEEVQKVCDRVNCTNAECFEFDISKTNDRMTWSIRNKKDVKYPLHKANVNNGQYPDSELIKNAFDL
ncbi:MAG: hypothetical protein ACON5K_09240 [Bacteroidia bacterium]